jgi:hypothetical protein
MLLADPADHFAALLDFNPFQCCRALGISLQAIVARILSDLFFLRFRHGGPLVLLGGKAIVRTRRKAQSQNCGENSENCFGHTTLPFLIHTTETECNFKMSDLNENRQTRNRVKAVSVAFAQLLLLRLRHGLPLVLFGSKALVRPRRKAQGQNCGKNSENRFGSRTTGMLANRRLIHQISGVYQTKDWRAQKTIKHCQKITGV